MDMTLKPMTQADDRQKNAALRLLLNERRLCPNDLYFQTTNSVEWYAFNIVFKTKVFS